MAQFLRPTSDVSAGAWVPSAGSDLYATVDESVVSDADYNYTLSESAFEVALGTGTDPALSTGHTVRYRAAGNGVLDLKVELVEGTTVRATWTEAAAATAFTNYSHTLTGGEADSITNYANLRLRFTLEGGFHGMALMVASPGITRPINNRKGSFFGIQGFSDTEANSQMLAPEDVTFSNMSGNIIDLPGTATLVFRNNTATGNQSLSWSATGVQRDTTNTDVVTSGNPFGWLHTRTTGDAAFTFFAANIEFSSGHGNIHASNNPFGTIYDLASTTRYISFDGTTTGDGFVTRAQAEARNRAYTSIESFQIRVFSNARTTDTTFRILVNGAFPSGGPTLTIASSDGAGLYTSTGSAASLADGDLWTLEVAYGAGTEALSLSVIAAVAKSTTNKSETMWGHTGNTRTASATEHFWPIGGAMTTAFTAGYTEAQSRIIPGFAATVSNLRLYIANNTYTANATLTIYKNGVSAMTTTITAGAANQWFENTADSFTINATDELSIGLVGGTSGSIVPVGGGFTFAP